MIARVLPLLSVALFAAAQSFPAPNALKKIEIAGNKRFTSEQIIAVSGLHLGESVTKELLDAARARLMHTGAFESVGYGFQPNAAMTGYEATFDVAEVALMYRYRFEDLPASGEALRAALHNQEPILGDMIPVTADVLERYDRTLTQFLAGKIEVIGRLSYDQPGEPSIVFRPAGERPRISQVSFTGFSAISAKQLFTTFADAAVGTEFSDASVRRLLDKTIVPLYAAQGRLRVSFAKITAEPTKEPEVVGVAVTIAIEEGPIYNLGSVRFAGDGAAHERELKRLASWRGDEKANFDEINAGLKNITTRFQGWGYLHAVTRVDRVIDDKDHTVDLVITVDQGALFSYGKLDVRGLDLIGEPAIRKMWGTKEGKPFDPAFPDSFLKEVRDQRMFDNLGPTSSETKINEDRKTVDVALIFAPAPKATPAGRDRLRQPF